MYISSEIYMKLHDWVVVPIMKRSNKWMKWFGRVWNCNKLSAYWNKFFEQKNIETNYNEFFAYGEERENFEYSSADRFTVSQGGPPWWEWIGFFKIIASQKLIIYISNDDSFINLQSQTRSNHIHESIIKFIS